MMKMHLSQQRNKKRTRMMMVMMVLEVNSLNYLNSSTMIQLNLHSLKSQLITLLLQRAFWSTRKLNSKIQLASTMHKGWACLFRFEEERQECPLNRAIWGFINCLINSFFKNGMSFFEKTGSRKRIEALDWTSNHRANRIESEEKNQMLQIRIEQVKMNQLMTDWSIDLVLLDLK